MFYIVCRKNSDEGAFMVFPARDESELTQSKADIRFTTRHLPTAEKAAEVCNQAEAEDWDEVDYEVALHELRQEIPANLR